MFLPSKPVAPHQPRFAGRLPRLTALATALALAAPAFAQNDADSGEASPASSEGVNRLVEALQSGESFRVRATAAVALGRMGDARALPVLADALRGDESYAVRAAAAAAIGRLGDVGGLQPLFEALHDRDAYVRTEASEALSRFRKPEHLFAFREALTSDDPLQRLAAVTAYGEVMREPGASVGLATRVIDALGDDDEAVAAAAAQAVSTLPHDRAVPLLVSGLEHGGSGVRTGCARLLEKRTDQRAVPALTAIVVDTDQSEDVRQAARGALRAHVEYLDVNKIAADAVGVAGPERQKALRLLSVLGDKRAMALIEKGLASTDPAERTGAARAAVDSADPRARAALQAAASRETDPRVKRQLELLLKSLH
jgi:HEAT repeat protein